MKRLTNSKGIELKAKGAKYQVDCAADESVYLLTCNVWLIIQSGRYYLAQTSDVNKLAWTTKLTYKG
jgi:hypothetical protein